MVTVFKKRSIIGILGWFGLCSSLYAADFEISDAWINAAPPNAMVLAGYMTLSNHTDMDIKVTSVASNHFSMIEMHQTRIQDGVARMELQRFLLVAAGKSLILEPNSWHLMLMGPKSPLQIGDQVELLIELDSKQQIKVQTTVKRRELE